MPSAGPTTAAPQRAPYRAAALTGAAVAVDVAFDPVHRHVPLCPLHALTGGWCPLCGGLRAAQSLTQLQFGPAVHNNALFVGVLPSVLAYWLVGMLATRAGRVRDVRSRYLVPVFVVVTAVFTVLRNLPFGAALRPG